MLNEAPASTTSVVSSQPQNTPVKFPDPTNLPPQAKNNSAAIAGQEVRKRQSFWWSIIVILIFIPVVTAVFIVANRIYVELSARRAVYVPTSDTINSALVVTPEQLPTPKNASEAAAPTPDATKTVITNDLGFYINLPEGMTAVTLDQPPVPPTSSTTIFRVMPTTEYDAGFVENFIEFRTFSEEPAQSATQSATRDFDQTEFKVYEYATEDVYVGRLPSGGWLQLRHQYNSLISSREKMEGLLPNVHLLTPVPLSN